MREICTSGSMRGQRALLAGLLYSQKGFTQNSQLKTQNAGYASCKENKILVTTGITGYSTLSTLSRTVFESELKRFFRWWSIGVPSRSP